LISSIYNFVFSAFVDPGAHLKGNLKAP